MVSVSRLLAAVALLTGPGAATRVSEVQCIGRVAHRVTYDPQQAPEEAEVIVEPIEEQDGACGLGSGRGADRPICVGVNHDDTCASARQPHLPLPRGASCEGCFLGLAADLFYAVNISGFSLRHVGVGVRGTALRAVMEVRDVKGEGSESQKLVAQYGETPLVWALKVLGRTIAEFKVSYPVTITYERGTKGEARLDAGSRLDLELGENSIDYEHGKGWTHRHDKAALTVHPILDGDVDGEGHLTFTVDSALRLEVTDLMWYQLNASAVVPVKITAEAKSEEKDLQACADAAVDVDVRHEADVDAHFGGRHVKRHFGPKVDRHIAKVVAQKCVAIHPKAQEPLVV